MTAAGKSEPHSKLGPRHQEACVCEALKDLLARANHPEVVDRFARPLETDPKCPEATRWSFLVDRCGEKLSSTIAIRASGG